MDRQNTGLTLVEVLLVLVTLGILLLLFLSAIRHPNERVSRSRCSFTLKQVALGFVLWANEHEGRFPMEVPVPKGGSREHALDGKLVPNFVVASNQMFDLQVLVCPSDKSRKAATTFGQLTTTNISYFLNVDAAYTNQSHIIAGDRDITTNGSPVRPGLLTIPDPSTIGWASILHKNGGHIALDDGSVHQVTVHQLRTQLKTGITNRFIIP